MKLFVKFLLFLLVLACALPFITLGPGGQPLMRIENLKWPTLGAPKLPVDLSAENIKNKLGLSNDDNQAIGETEVSKSTVYKWRNSDGEIQYTSGKPADGIPYETLAFRSDTNVLPTVKEPLPQAPEVKTGTHSREAEGGNLINELSSIYSPKNIKDLVDQAKEVQQISQERKEMLDDLTGKQK